ncbi:MAG: CHAT domain-containing protein [Candidatus Aminicenantes bacterium]|nr:CHAT domain-containing protein [Candidatus Aminicenantes bacterium]
MIHKNAKSRFALFFLVFFCSLWPCDLPNIFPLQMSSQSEDLLKQMAEGERLFREGAFDLANEDFEKSLEIARAIGDFQREMECLKKLGLIYWNRGIMEESLLSFTQALSLARKNKDLNEIVVCQVFLDIHDNYTKGKEYRSLNQNEKSILSFQSAIQMSQEIGSREHELKCCRQLGVTYLHFFRLQDFYKSSLRALELSRDLCHKREEGKCLINLGLFYQKTEDYSKSLFHYGKALDIAVALKNKIDESACLNNIGILYRRIGNFSRSLEYLKRALSLDRDLENQIYVSQSMNNIGTTFRLNSMLKGNTMFMKEALSYYFESLNISRNIKDTKTEIEVLNNIGVTYSALKDFERALKYFHLAVSRTEEFIYLEARCMVLNNIAKVYLELNASEEAEKLYLQAIELGLRISRGYILWEAYYGLGLCYENKQKLVQAAECYSASLRYIDRIRNHISLDSFKAGFARDKIKVYESLINLLYKSGQKSNLESNIPEIFNIIEQAKARAFLESLGESRVDLVKQLSPDLDQKERHITSEISFYVQRLSEPDLSQVQRQNLEDQLHEAEDEYMLLLSWIRSENPDVMSLVSPEPIPLESVQRDLLDNESAVVEYFLGEKISYGLVITKTQVQIFTLPSKDKIRDSLRAYLKVLSDPPQEKFKGTLASNRLYESLFLPAMETIMPSIEHLIIVPDDILYYLPFETLKVPPGTGFDENNYLVEQFKISYVPSCSSLLFLLERKIPEFSTPRILAFGSPIVNGTDLKKKTFSPPVSSIENLYTDQGFDLSPLPFSRKEVKNVVKFFKKENSQIYLDNQANEALIKSLSLKDYQVIHFACHGLLDEYSPFRSALVLSRGNEDEEDGFLQVREIYNLKMNAEMIVLSACQTGKGKIEHGEGVLGLPRIFFYTGAQSVLTSLWRIHDKSTAEFMNLFYEFLFQGNSKAQALRMAKLRMMKSRFSHPYYWAAFVLNGDFATSLVQKK